LKIPLALIESLEHVAGFNRKTFVEIHNTGQQVTSIRINPAKSEAPDFELPTLNSVPWTEYGYYLSQRPSFTFDPLFHAGCYYVQEASSMFLEQA
jgi:16S rRNA C967 or C1407 C5-methylase (RsmB/RsmF family)